jgi:hypothetical protein
MNISKLVDILKHRNINTIKYFHTDHFEPWSLGINDKTLRGLERFSEQTKKSKFTQKLSLFYLINLPAKIRKDHLESGWFVDGDDAGFAERDPKRINRVKDLMRPLERDLEHEIHLHIHHERWTQNSETYDPIVHAWVNEYSDADSDSRRLDLGLTVARSFMAQELGRPFDSWAFVHGNWALNASDHTICKIEDEIEILAKHGCWGDFTFPAGRGHCDPVILNEPYLIKPTKGIKSYDTELSDPKKINQFNNDFENNFFIWNSKIKARHSSLDYYDPANCELFKLPEVMVEKWLSESFQYADTLYLKTHAHSMKWEYEMHEEGRPIPHLFPDVVNVFETLERVCEMARVPIYPVTVNEVRRSLIPEFKPPITKIKNFPILGGEDLSIIHDKLQRFFESTYNTDSPDGHKNLSLVKEIESKNPDKNILLYIEGSAFSSIALLLGIIGYKVFHLINNESEVHSVVKKIGAVFPQIKKNITLTNESLFNLLATDNGGKKIIISNFLNSNDNLNSESYLFNKNINIITLNTDIAEFFVSNVGSQLLKIHSIDEDFLYLELMECAILENGDYFRAYFFRNSVHDLGHCYKLQLNAFSELQFLEMNSDNSKEPNKSTLILYQNGVKLVAPHSPHSVIRERGLGGYSHWKNTLYFSTLDNSNPNDLENIKVFCVEVKKNNND